jgi:hypothetical protein
VNTASPINWRDVAPEEWPFLVDLVVLPTGPFDLDPGDGRCSCGCCSFTPGQPRPCLATRVLESADKQDDEAPDLRPVPSLPHGATFWHTRNDTGRIHMWSPPDPKDDQSPRPELRGWSPSRWTDCGNEDCLECGALIAARKERVHRNWVGECIPVVRDWVAELFGTGQERGDPLTHEAGCAGCSVCKGNSTDDGKRTSRARWEGRAKSRIRWLLNKEQRAEALLFLRRHPVRRVYLNPSARCSTCPRGSCRCAWVAEVLLEIENPTVLVAKRDGRKGLDARLKKAIDRAQATLLAQRSDVVYIATHLESRRTPTRDSKYDRAA